MGHVGTLNADRGSRPWVLLGLCENAGMPNQPKTPITATRIPEELKAAAKAKAAERGETLTAVIVRGLEEYVASP